jgi:hypothetical protein
MRIARSLALLQLATLCVSSAVFADVRTDDFNDGVVSSALWTVKQSYTAVLPSRMRVTESDGQLHISGSGGGGAVLSKFKVDGNDNFLVRFKLSVDDFSNGTAGDAVVGLGLGFGANKSFNLFTGWLSGVQVEIYPDGMGGGYARLMAQAKKANGHFVSVQSDSVQLDPGPLDLGLFYFTDPATKQVRLELVNIPYIGIPICTLDNLPAPYRTLAGGAANTMTTALFALNQSPSTQMAVSFDDFKILGDLAKDQNDKGWRDADPSDGDEPLGWPYQYGLTPPQIDALFRVIETDVGHPLDVISASISGSKLTAITRENENTVRVLSHDYWDLQGLGTVSQIRAATAAELPLLAIVTDHDQVVPMPRLSVRDTHSGSLESLLSISIDSATSSWKLGYRTVEGLANTRFVPLNGLDFGDGVESLSFLRLYNIYEQVRVDYRALHRMPMSIAVGGDEIEFVVPFTNTTAQVKVARYNWRTGLRVSEAIRISTAAEAQLIPFVVAGSPSNWNALDIGFYNMRRFMTYQAIIGCAFERNNGVPGWRLTYLDGAGAPTTRLFDLFNP